MAWKDAFKYVQGIAAKHGMDSGEQREDKGLPLGGRIGGLLKMQMTPFIHASTSGSLMAIPEQGESLIRAISRVNLNMAGSLYRYYLATGDNDDKEAYLQLYQDQDGKVAELMYCTRLTRIIPETADEQEAYLGEAGYGLGDQNYTLWREQLAELGMDEADQKSVFGDADSLVYQRDAGDPHAEFYPPFKGMETRIDDAAGQHGLKQEIAFMPYARDIQGVPEYLLINTEIVMSQDGDGSRRGIHVDFMIGLPLEADRVVIQ
jgi:hypothetical protein